MIICSPPPPSVCPSPILEPSSPIHHRVAPPRAAHASHAPSHAPHGSLPAGVYTSIGRQSVIKLTCTYANVLFPGWFAGVRGRPGFAGVRGRPTSCVSISSKCSCNTCDISLQRLYCNGPKCTNPELRCESLLPPCVVGVGLSSCLSQPRVGPSMKEPYCGARYSNPQPSDISAGGAGHLTPDRRAGVRISHASPRSVASRRWGSSACIAAKDDSPARRLVTSRVVVAPASALPVQPCQRCNPWTLTSLEIFNERSIRFRNRFHIFFLQETGFEPPTD